MEIWNLKLSMLFVTLKKFPKIDRTPPYFDTHFQNV